MERLLSRGLKITHLRLAAALLDSEKLTETADMLGIAQPAASRLGSEIHEILGIPLFLRKGRGIELTEAGRAFCLRAQRVLREISDADREISEIAKGETGKVNIGTVTGPSIEYILPAIRQARLDFPNIQIAVDVAPSDQLCNMVLAGKIDFALARLPHDPSGSQFDYTPATVEPVSLVVCQNHPLLQMTGPKLRAALGEFDWVLPADGTILSDTVEAALRQNHIRQPQRILNTSSFLLTLAMISQSHAIAPVATSVAHHFEGGGTIRKLPIDFDIVVEEFGIIRRKDTQLTPSATVIHALASRLFAVSQKENSEI